MLLQLYIFAHLCCFYRTKEHLRICTLVPLHVCEWRTVLCACVCLYASLCEHCIPSCVCVCVFGCWLYR